MLRQNPHNVAEWHKRVKLFTGDPTKQVRTELFVCVCGGEGGVSVSAWSPSCRRGCGSGTSVIVNAPSCFNIFKRVCDTPVGSPPQILTYTEAVKTVDHDKALGKPASLWAAFARFYEAHGDLDNARIIFDKAVQARAVYSLSAPHCAL